MISDGVKKIGKVFLELVTKIDEFETIAHTEVEFCFKSDGSCRIFVKDLEGDSKQRQSFKNVGEVLVWFDS